ncbi:thiamine ABC transporter substrate-binding protein [Halorussus aquaticus]|uniref:Thiamine ABC transporter substrate binding subunit n=1 Tax=Halorussus aquaticus TaxID=2953748 RepID=A0ABD5Q6Q9_9EURY|nr:thiamine ABC transporter substrate-binding protein [Halorussus aquaticus]
MTDQRPTDAPTSDRRGRTSRRGVLGGTAAALTAVAGSGCLGGALRSSPDTLRVGTYKSFVDAPSTSAGAWVKKEFERRHDATLEWVVNENEFTSFVQRRKEGVDLGADAYVGVTPEDLVRANGALDDPLFGSFDTGSVRNAENIAEEYHFDPERRVLPTGASYVCLVYDERKVSAPPTLDALTGESYRDSLLLANPRNTTTGLLFLLWTVKQKGRDSYLDYWKKLMDNDVRVLGSWSDAYAAYSNGEAPMVVSYSTDQVYAANNDADMRRHQIGFPNDQGYAYVDGVGKFATTDRDGLVRTFAEFLLDPEVQRKTAVKNVGIPTVENASLPEEFRQYAHVPDEPVQFSYDVLAEHVDEWRDAWARQVASR